MKLIAAVDRNWAIGKGGELLVKIPMDQKYFMEETLGKTVVMGRRTFEGLPGRQPLYGRTNVVLSRDPAFAPKGVRVFRSLEETLSYLKRVPDSEIYIVGGESIYRMFLPYCSEAEITAINYRYDGDRFFPDLDRDPSWQLAGESDEETYFDLTFTFRHYIRTADVGVDKARSQKT